MLAAALGVATPLHGASTPPPTYLTIKVGYDGTAESQDRPGVEHALEFRDQLGGTTEMRPTAEGGVVSWYPRRDAMRVEGSIAQRSRTHSTLVGEGGVVGRETVVETYEGSLNATANLANAVVTVRAAEKRYDLQFLLMVDMASTWEAVQQRRLLEVQGASSVGGGRREESAERMPLDAGPQQLGLETGYYSLPVELKDLPLGDDAVEIAGSARIPVPKPASWKGSWEIVIATSWRLSRSLPPFELIVTSEAYDRWRPDAKPGPLAGTPIRFKATLKDPVGGRPMPKIRRFEWELIGTSHEPGIAMNFPLNASGDTTPDLKFEPAARQRVTGPSAQTLHTDSPEGSQDEVQVVPYDWGGWSTMNVRAILENGQTAVGRFQGRESDIRLPKRAKDSFIADAWKAGVRARGKDDSDDDNLPAGDRTNGDGLTLYQEYRGFYVAGAHVEGDPSRKDFFVRLNQVGLALPGVAKFQRITKLRVHFGLTAAEFPASRVINANRDKGPHRVDQHGIIVQVDPNRRGSAAARGGPGNPKKISSVDLMSNIAAFDATWIAATVAHELGHCVNIWHHGGGDSEVVWYAANGGLFERPARAAAGGQPIVVMNEQFANLTPAIIAEAEAAQTTFTLEKGSDQGQHSGFENCVMRYDCATTYVYRARNDVRVYGFSEPVGGALCTAPAGTGVNDPNRGPQNAANRGPQSRYGAAQQNRGGCVHQILVSDAVDAPGR